MGTLGAGNHYAEIQVVEEIFDKAAASKMGIDRKDQVRTQGCSFRYYERGSAYKRTPLKTLSLV